MRLFIAVALSDSMRSSLVRIQNAWYRAGVRGRYSPEENLHITLAFIGEYPAPDAVLDALSTVSFEPIPLALDGIGSFGDLWWAGLAGSPALEAVSRRILRALAENRIPFDRKRFSPHITLLRKAAVPVIPPVEIMPASMVADSIVLFRSDRGKNGMIYTGIGSIPACRGSYSEENRMKPTRE